MQGLTLCPRADLLALTTHSQVPGSLASLPWLCLVILRGGAIVVYPSQLRTEKACVALPTVEAVQVPLNRPKSGHVLVAESVRGRSGPSVVTATRLILIQLPVITQPVDVGTAQFLQGQFGENTAVNALVVEEWDIVAVLELNPCMVGNLDKAFVVLVQVDVFAQLRFTLIAAMAVLWLIIQGPLDEHMTAKETSVLLVFLVIGPNEHSLSLNVSVGQEHELFVMYLGVPRGPYHEEPTGCKPLGLPVTVMIRSLQVYVGNTGRWVALTACFSCILLVR